VGSADERAMGRGGPVKRASDRYPPREAFATRPSPELVAEGGEVGAITALDRPRFIEALDLGVPHTRERPSDSVPVVADAVQSRGEKHSPRPHDRASMKQRFPWLAMLVVASVMGVGGALFGSWLASGMP